MQTPILVTGGAGFIGAHVCYALAQAGFLPVAFDNLSAGHAARVKFGPLEVGDIRDAARLGQVMAQYRPKAVMHFAALISVPDSVREPLQTWEVNTLGSLNLLQAMQQQAVKHMVFSSTAAVYGIPTSVPVREDAVQHPINPYGNSKLAVEKLLADVSQATGMNYAALRYFNAAGATPDVGLGYWRAKPFHLIPLVMQAILGQRPPLEVNGTDYPTPDGTAVRDYIHVADLATAHVLALQHLLQKDGNLTLNLGTSRGYSVREVLAVAAEVTGQTVPANAAARRPGDPAVLVADASRAGVVLGWQPRRSGLAEIIADDWAWHQRLVNVQ